MKIFITGVAPITLDSLTSGFNIAKDLTRDKEFNGMIRIYRNRVKRITGEQLCCKIKKH